MGVVPTVPNANENFKEPALCESGMPLRDTLELEAICATTFRGDGAVNESVVPGDRTSPFASLATEREKRITIREIVLNLTTW
jgi:hypothetical protein